MSTAAYIENVRTGFCLNTRGAVKTPGTQVEQYTCESAANELYEYDPASGLLTGLQWARCVYPEDMAHHTWNFSSSQFIASSLS